MVKPYTTCVIQPNCKPPINPDDRGKNGIQKEILENIERDLQLIDTAVKHGFARGETRVRLVSFPEFFLHGSIPPWGPFGRTMNDWIKLSLKIPGPEIDMFAEKAVEHDIYVSGNTYEVDGDWPGRYFNTTWIISPEGKVILKYRKINTLANSPHDILTPYVEKYGWDALWPVVDTPLGKLGCMTCVDAFWPESGRALALKGAEVIIRPYAGHGIYGVKGLFDVTHIINVMRAFENCVYLVAPNLARIIGNVPGTFEGAGYGHSMIVNFRGHIICEAPTNNEYISSGVIDIEELRKARSGQIAEFISGITSIRTSAYARFITKEVWPQDRGIESPIATDSGRKPGEQEVRKEVLESLYKRGILVKPST